jgi:hypothetical protein
MSIVRQGTELAVWRDDHAFAAMNAHPFTGEFGRRYYPAVFDGRTCDATFAVVDGEQPLLFVPCSVGATDLDYYGMPIRLFERAGAGEVAIERAVQLAFSEFDEVMSRNNLVRASVADVIRASELSVIGKQCLNRKAVASLRLSGSCELSDVDQMRRDLRKSYRSLINWGRTNLKIEYVNNSNPDRKLFDRYQSFHHDIAGRSTRPQKSWDVMFEWLARGDGELVMGFMNDGSLVAGTMIVDGTEVSNYASGVYDRAKFDKPLAHWPLWLAIARSGERGKSQFDLGDIPIADVSQKEVDIGYFKRGFASRILTWIGWTWKPKSSTSVSS